MSDTDNTARKLSGLRPFRAGSEWTGNQNGRPKGSRNKLSEEFLADLLADWQEGGIAALKAAREAKPEIYCKMVAGLMPKEVKLGGELSELSDEQLAALGELVASLLGNEDESPDNLKASAN